MAKKSRPLWLFIVTTLAVFCLSMSVAYWFKFWAFSDPLSLLISGFCALFFGLLVGSVLWWFFGRSVGYQDDAQIKRQEKLTFLKQQMNAHLDACWRYSRQYGRSPYTLPWYIMLNRGPGEAELIQYMGFDSVKLESTTQSLPLVFWLNEGAVLIEIRQDFDEDSVIFCQDWLIKHLNKTRPRQCLNGVFLALPACDLISFSDDQLEIIAKKQSSFVKELNQSFGLDLPVYSLLTEMADVSDFCQYFAGFDQTQLEQPFGALVPEGKGGFDLDWFDKSFDELQTQLAINSRSALRAQLAESYRKSIVVGPFQFGFLKNDLAGYFRKLFLSNRFQVKALNFRGYFFVNAQGDGLPTDRLAMQLANQLGYSTFSSAPDDTVPHQLFARKLLSQSILPEKFYVGVNSYKENSYSFFKLIFSLALVAVFGLGIWLFKANYEHYDALEKQAQAQLATYKENLNENKDQTDGLARRISNLTDLGEIRAVFYQNKPWYVSDYLPNPSIKNAVDSAYDDALRGQLLNDLRDYLFRDIYAYNSLNDKVKLLELYNLQKDLFNPRGRNIAALGEYFMNSLQEEGVTDVRLISKFESLLVDLFALKAAPLNNNRDLVELVERSLASQDLGELLYSQLLKQPHLSKKVNLLNKLGQNYDDVLTFKNSVVFRVPFMFTREGFLEIMGSSGLDFANDWVSSYKSVVGEIRGTQDFSQINRTLRLQYTRDYIKYWRRFANEVQWQPSSGWSNIAQQLISATDPVNSPLVRLYELVDYHTNLALAVAPKEQTQEKVETSDSTGDVVKTDTPDLQAPVRDLGAVQAAETIAKPFTEFHRLIAQDDKGINPLGFAIQNMSATLEWIQKTMESELRGSSLLEQLKAEPTNPLQRQVDISEKYNGLVRDLLQYTASDLNDLAMLDVHAYLQERWQSEVFDDYQQQVANHYPFKSTSDQELSLATFNEFFAADGRINQFANRYQTYFSGTDDTYGSVPGFLSNWGLTINRQYWQMLEYLEEFQGLMFNEKTPGFDFSVRIEKMSSGVSEFTLRGDKPLYVYRNGPSVWRKMSWPFAGDRGRSLSIQFKSGSDILNEVSFNGIWSWFRLADHLKGESSSDATTNRLLWSGENESASLLVRVQSGQNPLKVGFFSQLELPEKL